MLRGVDLSAYQVGVNYCALGALDFAYVKLCDWNGAEWVQDAQALTHASGLQDYAVPFGLYEFGHPSIDVNEAASAFIVYARGINAKLRPVIDMESLSQGKTPGNAGQWARAWCDRVASSMVYASTSYYLAMLRQCPSLAGVPWWRAEYHDACPPSMPPGPPAIALQWTGHGRVDGVSGDADLDVVYASDLGALLL
jgi:GH25 family lysozyme M1 (1,4-beta-N-acetylmuramidase)